MRRKKWIILGVCMLFCMINIAGCVKKESKKITTGSSVDKIVKEKTEKKETQNTKRKETKKQQEESSQESKKQGGKQTPGSDVDYDLTNMSKDMVYATVYQLRAEPDKYIGKTLCIDGLYYTGQNEKTGTYYHYSIIKDALACCSQGMEFVWGDGSHVYPDEYPKDGTEIEVKGTFETYKEPGDDTLYCHLVNAEMQVK